MSYYDSQAFADQRSALLNKHDHRPYEREQAAQAFQSTGKKVKASRTRSWKAPIFWKTTVLKESISSGVARIRIKQQKTPYFAGRNSAALGRNRQSAQEAS